MFRFKDTTSPFAVLWIETESLQVAADKTSLYCVSSVILKTGMFCCFDRNMSEMVRSAWLAACSFLALVLTVCGYRKQVLGVLPDSS